METTLYLSLSLMLLFAIFWLGIVWYLKVKKKKQIIYIFFFTLFYIYLYKVLDYTLFEFQSLIILKYFVPDLLLQGHTAVDTLNLIPLLTLTSDDLLTSLLNILLFVPFGFGLPFITTYRMKQTVLIGALFSLLIELTQLITGYLANITFRVADVDDVIFNTIGVVVGYILFIVFVRFINHIISGRKTDTNKILRFIGDRPQF